MEKPVAVCWKTCVQNGMVFFEGKKCKDLILMMLSSSIVCFLFKEWIKKNKQIWIHKKGLGFKEKVDFINQGHT